MSSASTFPLSALRATALHTQRLAASNDKSPRATPKGILDVIKALGYVQIDTLHVVNRAHYVTIWARFGSYDITAFDKLVYSSKHRVLYEGWGHAASLIPLEHYRYHRWRANPKVSYNPCFLEWAGKSGNRELAAQTLERIRSVGGLRVSEFESGEAPRGPWYDWHPSKMALEALFAWGDLMVADRVKFQRVYDVRERVLPEKVDITPVEPDEARRFCLEHAARALGVFESRALTFYAYMRATPAASIVRALIEEGVLLKIRGESTQGIKHWLIHRDNLRLLQRAADGEIKPERTTFLAPFDSLFWGQGQKLWGFKQLLECYKPAPQRVYGYFCFPILHKDRLIGRFDPKLDRKSGVLTLNALHLEPNVKPDEELIASVAMAMRDFLKWHGARNLEVKKSNPPEFGKKILRAL